MSSQRSDGEERSKRDKSSSDDDFDGEGSLHENPGRKANRRGRQNRNSHNDQERRSKSPRRRSTRKKRSKSQVTYYSVNNREPQPRKAMEALNDIDGYYVYLNRKYHKKLGELTEKCELQQIQINQLEAHRRNQRERADDAERKNSKLVLQKTSLIFQIEKLERKNEELEATVKRMTRDHDELEMKYDDQVNKERRTKKRLEKATEKIKKLQDNPKGGPSQREKALEKDHKRDQKVIEEKDKEIEELKDILSKLQKKSISIRDELKSVDTRNRK